MPLLQLYKSVTAQDGTLKEVSRTLTGAAARWFAWDPRTAEATFILLHSDREQAMRLGRFEAKKYADAGTWPTTPESVEAINAELRE